MPKLLPVVAGHIIAIPGQLVSHAGRLPVDNGRLPVSTGRLITHAGNFVAVAACLLTVTGECFALAGLRIASASLLICLGVAAADEPKPLEQLRDQKEALAHAEQTARRILTSLRVLNYQKIDPGAEQKLLEEIAGSLRHLSEEEIRAVLAHLEAAVKAPDEAAASAAQQEAYQHHRQIVARLRGILTRLDVLKSLDQAAGRVARMAEEQRRMHEKSLRAEYFRPMLRGSFRRVADDRDEQADSQSSLRAELTNLVQQLGVLRPTLNPEQKQRLDRADFFGRAGRILADMELAAAMLTDGDFGDAADKQLAIAHDLLALAHALRGSRDPVLELKEARGLLDAIIREQDELKHDTAAAPEHLQAERERQYQRGNRNRQDPAAVQAHQLADRQDRIEFAARNLRYKLDPIAPDLSAALSPAEKQMRYAQDALRNLSTDQALPPQENARQQLQQARDMLLKQLEQAELTRSDPLAAVQNALQKIDQLLAEQTNLSERTSEAQSSAEIKELAVPQREIAQKAEEVRNLPMPPIPELARQLRQAAQAANQAAQKLAQQNKAAAQPRQEDARKALEQAKKTLEQQASKITQRREELAKLEDAARTLEDLHRQENALAQEAELDREPKQKQDELAQRQEKIQPATRQLADQLQQQAPNASEKLDRAQTNMEQARREFQDRNADTGAQQAQQAAQELQRAREALTQQAEQLRSQEILDQAAMQPSRVDPQAAADQLAKALEQTEQARKQAEQAQRLAEQARQQTEQAQQQAKQARKQPEQGPQKAEQAREQARKQTEQARKQAEQAQRPAEQPRASVEQNLARLQQALADEASRQNLSQAARAAASAAENLQRAEFSQALKQQQQAYEHLEAAGRGNSQTADTAKRQWALRQATEALANSQQANEAAQAALNQAQAQAPPAVQSGLSQAQQRLQSAQQQLKDGKPADASTSQQQAAQQLSQALRSLQEAANAMGQPSGDQQASNQAAQADAQPLGNQPGPQPSNQAAQNQPANQPSDQSSNNPQERNDARGQGNRQSPGQMKHAAAAGAAVDGDGTFIELRKKEREKVLQSAEQAFPAEFRELIKQYNINIKNLFKPQAPSAPAPPAPEPKR